MTAVLPLPASMSNNLVCIWSNSEIITPENCSSVMRNCANVCGEYCQQQSHFLLRNPLTHNLASHMWSPPVLRRPISWEVEYSQLNYWLEYPPHPCGNGIANKNQCGRSNLLWGGWRGVSIKIVRRGHLFLFGANKIDGGLISSTTG